MPTGETIRKINVGGTEHDVVGSADALWGSIQGSINSQTDLKNALDAKQGLLTFDNTPTAGSNNPVKSGGIKTELDKKLDYYLFEKLGAKNLLPNPNYGTYTSNGITFTTNSDGSFSTSAGTPSGNVNSYLLADGVLYRAGEYIFSGFPDNTGISANAAFLELKDTGWGQSIKIAQLSSENLEQEFTLTEDTILYIRPYLVSGYALPAMTFKPMIRLASDTDDTYEPYADTNRNLTLNKCDNSVIAPVESGATASRAYAAGEHFIRDGAFCTAKTSIASGAAFTLNTNYKAGRVADATIQRETIGTPEPIGTITVGGTTYTKYRKIIDFGYLPDSNVKSVAHNISFNRITAIYGIASDAYKHTTPIPSSSSVAANNIAVFADNTNVSIRTGGSGYTAYYAYITVEYY